MDLDAFDFFLPRELIAQEPLPERSASRLFCYDRRKKEISHENFSAIAKFFGPEDVLVLNDSRVIKARFRWNKAEIFLAEPVLSADKSATVWRCLVRPGKSFRPGQEVLFPDGTRARVEAIEDDGLRRISFNSPDFPLFVKTFGEIPLPPYITLALQDEERYQTVFAASEGSVAAPTAGLHFTPEILSALRAKGTQIEFITLHVGLGTFLPVKEKKIEDHLMHREHFFLSEDTATRLTAAKKQKKRITAVGTTVLRTLESCYDHKTPGTFRSGPGTTALFLYPPASFRAVDQLLTNFHLPKSTLVMLVSAFLDPGGTEGVAKVGALYSEAIKGRYRFFSFGDAMLIR